MVEREEKRERFPYPEVSELNFDKLTDRNGVNVLGANVINTRTEKLLGTVYVNLEAYERMIEIGELVAWSRERAEIWQKGLTSGHRMYISNRGIVKDCDSDTIGVYVNPIGPFCHRGNESCFD